MHALKVHLDQKVATKDVNSSYTMDEDMVFTTSRIGGPSKEDLMIPDDWNCPKVHVQESEFDHLMAEWTGPNSPFRGAARIIAHKLMQKYMASDASKDFHKATHAASSWFNHMEHGGAPDALSFHIGEYGPATMFEEKAWQKTAQKVLANDNSMPIGMYAIGVSFLTLAAMLGFRMR